MSLAAGAEAQTLSISAPANANEGNSGTRDLNFTVTLSSTVSSTVIFDICFSGTATLAAHSTISAGEDYVPYRPTPVATSCFTSNALTAGQTSYTGVGIQIRGDTDFESDETVIATLSWTNGYTPPAGVTLGTTTATHTILNDDTAADTTAPRVTSITRRTPSTSPTNVGALSWRVTFNEAVQNVDATDFQVSGPTNAFVSLQRVDDGYAIYDVVVARGNLDSFDGTVTLSFANGQNIEDSSGNALGNTTPTGTNDNTFEVDNTAPRVTSITRQTPSSSPTDADSLTWRVLFNEAVQNVNAADF